MSNGLAREGRQGARTADLPGSAAPGLSRTLHRACRAHLPRLATSFALLGFYLPARPGFGGHRQGALGLFGTTRGGAGIGSGLSQALFCRLLCWKAHSWLAASQGLAGAALGMGIGGKWPVAGPR